MRMSAGMLSRIMAVTAQLAVTAGPKSTTNPRATVGSLTYSIYAHLSVSANRPDGRGLICFYMSNVARPLSVLLKACLTMNHIDLGVLFS
jgi:hypothetical protein